MRTFQTQGQVPAPFSQPLSLCKCSSPALSLSAPSVETKALVGVPPGRMSRRGCSGVWACLGAAPLTRLWAGVAQPLSSHAGSRPARSRPDRAAGFLPAGRAGGVLLSSLAQLFAVCWVCCGTEPPSPLTPLLTLLTLRPVLTAEAPAEGSLCSPSCPQGPLPRALSQGAPH